MILNSTFFTFLFDKPHIFANTHKLYPIKHVHPFLRFVSVRYFWHAIQNFTLFATNTTTKQAVTEAVIFCFILPKSCLKISYAFFLELQSYDTYLGHSSGTNATARLFGITDCRKINSGVTFVTFLYSVVQFGLKMNWKHKQGRTARLRHKPALFYASLLQIIWSKWVQETSGLFGSAPKHGASLLSGHSSCYPTHV